MSRNREYEPYTPTSWEDVPLVLSLRDAAQIVGQTPEHLAKLAQHPDPQKRFPAGKIGDKPWIVEKTSLIEYLHRIGAMAQ